MRNACRERFSAISKTQASVKICNLVASPALRFDGRLIHQHDGDVVLHRIDPVALLALEAFGILPVVEGLTAGRADQVVQ